MKVQKCVFLKEKREILGFTPGACKPCSCPASGWKQKPGVRDRDISGLMDGGVYTTEARLWSNNPRVQWTSRTRWQSLLGGDIQGAKGGEIASYRGN